MQIWRCSPAPAVRATSNERVRCRRRAVPTAVSTLLRADDWLHCHAVSEEAVRQQLATLGVDYEIIPCDPDLADTAQFCAAYGYAPEDSANTILVIGKSDPPRYAACLALANTRLDVNRTVRNKLGTRKASFAPAEDTRAITGMMIGGVTVFGLPPDLPILVDSRVMERPRIVMGGGSRSCKVVAPPAILLRLPNVEVVEGLANPIPTD